jgi:hypothetical protein
VSVEDALRIEHLKLSIARLKTEAERSQKPEPEPIKILTIDEILNRPDPVWLVEEWLQDDSLAVLAGESDSFKSFLAMDWGLSIAFGIDWLWHETKRGPVVYIYAEGGSGIGKRVRAWLGEHRQAPPTDFYGIDAEVVMSDPERVTKLIEAVKELRLSDAPKLLIIDTLAQNYGPGNENSTQDMNAFLRGCKSVKRAFPAMTVLVLHHTGWMTEHERGASNLRGALDTLIRVWEKTADEKIRVGVVKQKNFKNDRKGGGMWLQLVDVPPPEEEGGKQGSAVLRMAEPPVRTKDGEENKEKVTAILAEAYPKGLKPGELHVATGINQNTLKDVRRRMVKAGTIREEDGRIFAVPQDG